MVQIPVGWEYTAYAEVTVPKTVRCEQCRHEYHYLMKRRATGSGTSALFLDNRGASQRAEERAADALSSLVKTDCDPVPCPECGWYQARMVEKLRRGYHRWLIWVGAVLLVAAAPTFAAALARSVLSENPKDTSARNLVIVATSLVVSGFGLMIARGIMGRRFDPNASDPEERRRIGQGRAVSKEEIEERLRAENGEDG